MVLIESAEKALRELGSTWEWLADGCCRTVTTAVPAVRLDNLGSKRSMRKTFFNSMVAAYTGTMMMMRTSKQASRGPEAGPEAEQRLGRLSEL